MSPQAVTRSACGVSHRHHMQLRGTHGMQLGYESAIPDLPLASASSDMIRWSRVLLSHTLDAARSY